VLTIARDLGITVIERPVDKSELFIADEVFLSGTAAKVTPVKQVEMYKLSKERPVTDKIREMLTAVTENREAKYQDWVYKVRLDG
jgi:branched-chain amino acid aminotransferase